MHFFLTGEIQVGKTTIISKVIEHLQVIPSGFKTYFGPDRNSPDRLLYMNSAFEPKDFREEYAVARFFEGKPPEVLVERFSSYGAALIRCGRKNGSKLIIMDECGNLERDAFVFQQAVMEALDGSVPILGVVKKIIGPSWTDQIRKHPKVQLLTVTGENRDELPAILAGKLAAQMDNMICVKGDRYPCHIFML